MLPKFRSHLTYANIVSSLCLFLVLGGGTAFAVTQIDNNSVFTRHIVNGEVRNVDLGPNVVNGEKVTDGSLEGADLADGAVGTGQIADGGVTDPDLASFGVTNSKLAPNSVTFSKLFPNAVDESKISSSSVEASELTQINERVEQDTIDARPAGVQVRRDVAVAECLPGEQVVGGGHNAAVSSKLQIGASQRDGNGWRIEANNFDTASSHFFAAKAYCLAE